MATYSVSFKSSVEKDLRGLPRSVVARVLQHVERLKQNPLPRQSIKLEGAENLHRLRIGDYRIVYAVDVPGKRVIVHYVRHRRDVYRRL